GGTSDTTWTAGNADRAISTNVQLARTEVASFADRVKSAISSSDGKPVDLDGVNFDSSGSVTPTSASAIARLGQMINDNPSLKVNITAYGQTSEQAASHANAIKSALVAAGVPEERLFIEPQVDDRSVPRISFTK